MSSFMPCGCSKKSEWYYRGKWHELPVPRCGACGVGVNGCRRCGAFFSIKKWEYECDVCFRQRQKNRPLVCAICGGEDEHIFFHVP